MAIGRSLRAIVVGSCSGFWVVALSAGILGVAQLLQKDHVMVAEVIIVIGGLSFAIACGPVLIAAACQAVAGPNARWPSLLVVGTVPASLCMCLRLDPFSTRAKVEVLSVMHFLVVIAAAFLGATCACQSIRLYLRRASAGVFTKLEGIVWTAVGLSIGVLAAGLAVLLAPSPVRIANSVRELHSVMPIAEEFRQFPSEGSVAWRREYRSGDFWTIRGKLMSPKAYLEWQTRNDANGNSRQFEHSPNWPCGDCDENLRYAGLHVVTDNFRYFVTPSDDGRFWIAVRPESSK